MNEHYDPSLGEVLAGVRDAGWRAWLVFVAAVAVSLTVLWLADPRLAVLVVFAAVFIHPGARAVARVVVVALFLVAVAAWIAVRWSSK